MLDLPIQVTSRTDIAAVTATGVSLAVEVDGPSHFVRVGSRREVGGGPLGSGHGAGSSGLHSDLHTMVEVGQAEGS